MRKLLYLLALTASAYAQPVRDGKLLVNYQSHAGQTAICTVTEDGSVALLHTANVGMLLDPSWAPDGGVFFVLADRAGKTSQLRWMSGQGTDERVVQEFPRGLVFQPTPSPDGKHLLFYVVSGGLAQLWLAEEDGSEAHPVGPPGACFPAWSSDSQKFLAVMGNTELKVFNLEGTELRTFCSGQAVSATPAWSPDGQHLVLARIDQSGRSHLYRLDAQAQNLQALTQGTDGAEMGAYFDSSGKLYYNRLVDASVSVWSCDCEGKNAKLVVENAAIHGGASLMWLTSRQDSPR